VSWISLCDRLTVVEYADSLLVVGSEGSAASREEGRASGCAAPAGGDHLSKLHIGRPACPRSWFVTGARTADLLQGLAGPQHRRPLCQGPVHPRFHRRAADLPAGGACRSSSVGPFASRRTPARSARCGPLSAGSNGPQHRHPSRRGAAGGTAAASANPEGRAKLRETHPGRARPCPRRVPARPPRPLPGHPQEPGRPTPRRRRPQRCRHRLPACHRQSPASLLTAT
jgi:hypothetical protein